MQPDQPTELDAFRDWLRDELREAGCEIRTLSPEGTAAVAARRLAEQGWSILSPGAVAVPVQLAYEHGLAEGRQDVERLTLLLEQAEQYARDLQDSGVLTDEAREHGLAEGRRQATEGWEREWGAQYRDDSWVQATFDDEASAVAWAAEAVGHRAVSRLVGPWEPAEPEHAFDESSIVNPATGEPYRGSSGPEPYEPPDPLCVCGAPWLGDEGCLTQQPGWTPPPPYDGPSIEELLPAEPEAEEGHRD